MFQYQSNNFHGSQVMEGQIQYFYHPPMAPPLLQVYRRTSYISLLSTPPTRLRKDKLHIHSIFPIHLHLAGYGKTSYIFLLSAPPTRLRKDTLRIPIIYPTHIITEGQVTYPYCLPHLPGYGRTHYISLLSASPT